MAPATAPWRPVFGAGGALLEAMSRPSDPGRTAPPAAAPPAAAVQSEPDELSVEVCPDLSRVTAAEWDRLLEPDDRPLLSWAYLQGLEQTGCVGEKTGWLPAHLLVRRHPAGPGSRRVDSSDDDRAGEGGESGELVAAAPTYLKAHSEAEWVYDFDWAEFAAARGIAYYPKLVAAVPFNPVTGGRLLARIDLPPSERQALRRLLLRGMKKLCQRAQLSSAHVLFPRGLGSSVPEPSAEPLPEPAPDPLPETDLMPEAGFVLRRQEQYHFLNERYRDFEDFLGRMSGHKRNTIRRERRALREAGITVRTHRGLAPSLPGSAKASPGATEDSLEATPFSLADLDQVFDMYVGTSVRYTGEAPFLSRAFFHLCAERLGDRLELVLARDRTGRIVGGAFNLRGDRRVFGRYWGATEAIPFLHFEVCYYHPVERTIREGLDAFEPGHGGEQKLVRGFTPVYTYSAHYLRDPRLRRPIAEFLRYEAPLVEQSLASAKERCPIRGPIRGPAATEAGGPPDPDKLPAGLVQGLVSGLTKGAPIPSAQPESGAGSDPEIEV